MLNMRNNKHIWKVQQKHIYSKYNVGNFIKATERDKKRKKRERERKRDRDKEI